MAQQSAGLLEIREEVQARIGPPVVQSIRTAYARTLDVTAYADVAPRLQPMLAGMARYALVQNALLSLPDALPQASTQLRPNANRTWWHVEGRLGEVLFTVESVQDMEARPRPAIFRRILARLQGRFDIVKDALQVAPRESAPEPYRYLHILHGRAADRESLGFVVAVFETDVGEYDPDVMVLYTDEHQEPDTEDLNIIESRFPFSL